MDGVISLPSATHKSPEVDISSFLGGGGSDTKTSSPVNVSFPENVASPPMRSNTLSPAVPPPPTQNTPGQPGAGPHPHVQHHPHQQPQQQFPPSFVPASMRNPGVGGGPRSPSIARAMPNGAPGRPPVNSGPPGPNNSNMPSPRLAPPQPHVPHQHQHQGQPAPVQGMPHMPTVPGWPGNYVSAQDSADAPEASSAGTPPHLCLESRLDCNVSTFVPSHAPPPVQRQSKIKITDASGHEVDLDRLRKHGATPSTASSTPASDKIGRRAAIRLETEEARLKRIEEERQQKEKEEGEERKRRQAKETEERKRREEEEKAKAAEEARIKAEEERKRKEEEEQRRKEEEEKECARLEEECKRKEEEQKREEDEENDCVKLKELGKKISSEAAINPALSALATARHIQDVYHVPYPEGIVSPKPELNMSAKDGKFRYDRDFLLQFMSVCKQKPGEFPDLVAMGLKPIDPSHVKHRVSPRQRDISRGIDTTSKNSTCRFSVGPKVRSEERIARSTLFGGKPNPLHSSGSHTPSIPWSSVRLRSSEIEDNEVRTLINKLSMEDFEFTSNQIIVWVNKRKNIVWVNERENERVGRALIQVIRLVFEKAVDKAAWSEMYARLCQKMMEQISPDIQDDGFRDAEDGPISDDLLFREYLLNHCQEDFERTWSAKEMTAVVAKEKKTRKKAVNDTSEENEDADGDVWLYWDEHNAALEAKHQALRLVKFMGELFKLQMLPDHIMHECIKELLSSVDDPDEEEIECLCALLTNIGQALDTSKARGHMAIYFTRMKVLSRSSKVQPHVQAMLQDVIELRERKWIPRNADTACPLQDHTVSMHRAASSLSLDSPEVVDKKVRALLNKLTKEKFESISNQIIAWANKSENEKDGRTLIQVVRLVLEKAKDEADSNEIYARLCRKMMEQISPNIQDDGIRNAEGKPITGGLLFRKYLLNRCQEDLERGWSAGKATVAPAKETENQAVENADEKNREEYGEVSLSPDEYFAVPKAKHQGLGLIKFIGELYKLQMLTERIMHECIKKILNNEDNRKEEETESLCKLLSTVGQALDTCKARGHMDVYFTRMKELARSSNVSSRMQFMLQDVIELREWKWIPRNAAAAPQTIAQIHETAAREKAQQEQHNLARQAMSRGGSCRWQDRDGIVQVGPDGWAVASGPSRPANKAGDLTNFGKLRKGSGAMNFGPASVFTKKGDSKRDSASLSRASSNTNMFQMLQATEAANEPPAASTPSRASRATSRTASVDLTHNASGESTPSQRPKLNLLPRSKPLLEASQPSPAESHADEDGEEGEIIEKDSGKPSMSKEQAEKKVDQDRKEFFAIRDLDEGEEYFSALPTEYRPILIEKLILYALEAKETEAKLVADLFERVISRNLCSPATFEEGFLPATEMLDDIAIDAPKAFNLMAIMMKGVKLDEERRTRIAGKSMDSDKLLALLS